MPVGYQLQLVAQFVGIKILLSMCMSDLPTTLCIFFKKRSKV